MRRLLVKFPFKYQGSTLEKAEKLTGLRIDRGAGTAGVVVKYVDISWNTKGESRYLELS